jgi:hypothetical protein
MIRFQARKLSAYRRGGVSWVIWGAFVLFGLFGLGGLIVDSQLGAKIFDMALAFLGFWFAYGIWRAARIAIYPTGVLVGTVVRPRWIPWTEIVDVSLQPDRSGYGRRGYAPVIRLRSGRQVKLGFFFVTERASSEQDIAHRVVQGLGAHVAAAS